MIGLLIAKNWKLLLNIVIVLAIIFLVFLWNPFNIFGKGLKLQDTANMVSEIREIGELITAEYYGEIIATDQLHDIEIEEPDYFLNQANNYYLDLKNSLFSAYVTGMDVAEESVEKYRNERRRSRKLAKEILDLKSEIVMSFADSLVGEEGYQFVGLDRKLGLSMLLYVANNEYNMDVNFKRFVERSNDIEKSKKKGGIVHQTVRSVLSREYENIQKYSEDYAAFADYLNQGFTTTASFRDFHYAYLDRGESRKERKKELALIGRGSVKAGFRFGELTEENFVYDDNRKAIHFYGFKAEILNQDINPWFIPERKVPGFEILLAEGKIGFEDMKAMKSKCIKVLRRNAEKAGIIEQAHANGEEAMKEFFSLILDKEIRHVVFHQDMLTYRSDEILTDDVIDIDELDLIASLYTRNLKAIEHEDNLVIKRRRQRLLKDFLLNLKEADSVEGIAGRKMFNFFNRHIPVLLADSMLIGPEEEWSTIQRLRHNPVKNCRSSANQDSICYAPLPENWVYWFQDSLEYIAEYNSFINYFQPDSAYFLGYFKRDSLTAVTVEFDTSYATKIDGIIASVRKELIKKDRTQENPDILFVQQDDQVIFYTFTKMDVPADTLTYILAQPKKGHSHWGDLVESDTLLSWKKSSFTNSLFTERRLNESSTFYQGIRERDKNEKTAILRYLEARNSSYHNIGPIMKARRQFEEFVREDSTMSNTVKAVKEWTSDVRKRVGRM